MNSLYEKFKNYTIEQIDDALYNAGTDGDFETVRYLLTNNELKIRPNIHKDDDALLLDVCINGHEEIVKYLLTSDELQEKANIHGDQDNCFRAVCSMHHLDLLRYFIFELNIDKTKNITEFLEEYPKKEALDWFACRELQEKLRVELTSEFDKINKHRSINKL